MAICNICWYVVPIEILDLEQVCWHRSCKYFWGEQLVNNRLTSTLDEPFYFKGTVLHKIGSAEKIIPFFKHASSSVAPKISMVVPRKIWQPLSDALTVAPSWQGKIGLIWQVSKPALESSGLGTDSTKCHFGGKVFGPILSYHCILKRTDNIHQRI
jgi:hypothetical protein